MNTQLRCFAYGSNMLKARMCERVPSAKPIGVAELHGYELKWHKKSKDGSGKCDIVQSIDTKSTVYGVLYDIPSAEKIALDKAEGLNKGYSEKTIIVRTHDEKHEAVAYYATSIEPSLRPYSWYKALVVSGAEEHNLPVRYINSIIAIESTTDGDAKRHLQNMALINVG